MTENEHLRELAQKPFLPRSLGYMKMTGPGLLQSAMTLGAGSAAASVVAGASFGYKLLWVQPVAMFLGVMMFAAVSKIVLTHPNERPYWYFMGEAKRIFPPLMIFVFLWAFGTITASVLWHFPQYGLAAGAGRTVVKQFVSSAVMQSLSASKCDEATFSAVEKFVSSPVMQGSSQHFTLIDYGVLWATGILILLINIVVVFQYGKGGIGIRIYEWFLRAMIGLVFITFLMVVILNFHKLDWTEMFLGFIGYYGIPDNGDPVEYAKTITTVLGMIGAAVGINMTFLYPYSLTKKGWGEEHKALAKWDLGITMFLPFVLVTSLIMIGMTVGGIYNGGDLVQDTISPLAAAAALQSGGLITKEVAIVIFCGGLFGMTCGAISAHMTCCGFTWCEMFGLKQTTWKFRLFALTPSIGILGVVFPSPLWFPIVTSAVCLTMLPIAYLLFLIFSNSRKGLGDAVGRGFWHTVFNLILVIALLAATVGAVIKVKSGLYDKLFPPAAVHKTSQS